MRRAFALAFALALTCAAREARAFCGFFVGKADAQLFNRSSQVALVRDGERTVLTMSNDYKGPLGEFALVVPVLMVLIMGVLDGALLMFSVGTARYSSAEGSRVAATLGNVANTDSQVVATVRNIVSGTQLFTVTEVDIYKLNQDGNGNLTQDVSKTNKYALDGTPLNATPWPPTSRNVGNGTSDFIGITVNYTYTWKAGFFAPLGPLRTTAISYVRIEPQSY